MPVPSAKTILGAAVAVSFVVLVNPTASYADQPEAPPVKSAIVLTRYAVEAFEKHNVLEASKFSQEALSEASSGRVLPEADAGLDELILAKVKVFRGQQQTALMHYERAVSHFERSGQEMHAVLSLSYAEMALLYMQLGDAHGAEQYMEKAKLAETNVQKWTPEEQAYLRDMRAHYLCATGRLTDARNTLRDTLDLFENNPRLTAHSRGHLYRDFAQIDFASGDKNAAITYLNKSMDSLKADSDNGRDLMFTLTMLAEYQSSEHDDKKAEASYQMALDTAHGFLGIFPRETARVLVSWGTYLSKHGRWREAQGPVSEAVKLADSLQGDSSAKAQYLYLLAKIDRHVHEKHEAAEAEHRAKDVTASAKLQVPRQALTVDVLALRGPMQ